MRTSILLILIGIFADSYGAGTTTHILADPRNDTRDTAAIGLSGTFGNYASPGGEVYFKRNIRVFKQSTELKLGLNYRTYDIELDDVTGLNVGSVGLFADLTWFPFRSNGLFGGIRWEGINLNWLSDESREKYRQETGNT